MAEERGERKHNRIPLLWMMTLWTKGTMHSPVPQDTAQHIRLPNGTCVLSSHTQVLPRPNALCPVPAGPLMKCPRCHSLGHYHENCPSYSCPHCHLSTPGHPSSDCLQYQCGFCHNQGHHDWFCPHHTCGVCNTPRHIIAFSSLFYLLDSMILSPTYLER